MATTEEGVIICGMVRNTTLAFLLLVAFAAPLAAQAPDAAAPEETAPETAAPAPPRSMIGSWEFSNADREKTCTITFRNDNVNSPELRLITGTLASTRNDGVFGREELRLDKKIAEGRVCGICLRRS